MIPELEPLTEVCDVVQAALSKILDSLDFGQQVNLRVFDVLKEFNDVGYTTAILNHSVCDFVDGAHGLLRFGECNLAKVAAILQVAMKQLMPKKKVEPPSASHTAYRRGSS